MAYSQERIEASLRRIEASGELADSPQLRKLLRYLVAEQLAGRGDRLKGYTIGVEVFDKGESFDPAQDSLVRVQMTRLRSALDTYYAGEGAKDDPRILLVPGNYAPQFAAPVPTATPGDEAASTDDAASPAAEDMRELRWLMAAAVIIVLAIIVWPWLDIVDDPIEAATERPGGPVVIVAAYPASGPDAELAHGLRDGLQHDLITNLAQLPHLGVIGFDSVAEREFADVSQAQGAADFLLVGSITLDSSSFRVNSNLIRTRDSVVVWSQSTQPIPLNSGNFLDAQTEIALSVAAELGQPYGAIHEAMRMDAENHDSVSLQNYFCELDAYEYMRTKDAEERATVRTCLERAVGESPDYSDAWALLAWIYGDDARLGASNEGMDRALFAAEQAVRSNPTSAIAHAQLGIAQYFSGNDEAAVDAYERALHIAPNNTEILANAAWVLASINDDADAPLLAEKAISLNPGHPPWYWLGPVLSSLLSGDSEEALRTTDLYAAERTSLPRFLRAAALSMAGNADAAESVLGEAMPDGPYDQADIANALRTWRLPEPVEQMILGIPAD